MDPTLSWIVALAVVTIVVSCCVMYAIRQVFTLTERVNKSQQAVSQLEQMQTQIRQLTDLTADQAKRTAEKREEIEQREKSAMERDPYANDALLNRLEHLEKGLVEHEAKVEDAITRAIAAESKAAKFRGGGVENLDGKTALDMSVADFANLMNATTAKGGDAMALLQPALLQQQLSMSPSSFGFPPSADAAASASLFSPRQSSSLTAANLAGAASGHFSSSHHAAFPPPMQATGGGGGGAYAPSPAFQQLLDHGSLKRSASDPSSSPSGGLFANALPAGASARIGNQFVRPATKAGGGGGGTPPIPPAFWIYEQTQAAATATVRSLRRRLHSITYVSGEGSSMTSLVLRFAAPESVSSSAAAAAGSSSPPKNRLQKSDTNNTSFSVEMSTVPADGAGPGVTAIPIGSIALIDVQLAPYQVAESFSSITGNCPVLHVRVEHRGVLGEWSPSRQIVRDRNNIDRISGGLQDPSSTTNRNEVFGEKSPNREFSNSPGNNNNNNNSGGWTRKKALERAANVPACSSKGAASTALAFFLPLTNTNGLFAKQYFEFLYRVLESALVIDGSAARALVSSANAAMQASADGSSSSGGGAKKTGGGSAVVDMAEAASLL